MTELEARRDFGSFHASNVQELLSVTEDKYKPPPIPFETPNFKHLRLSDSASTEDIDNKALQFGRPFRKRHFLLEEGCTFLNHGAFGCVLKESLKVSQKWQEYAERQPLRFFDREILPHLVHVTRRLAKFVDCDPEELALVTNATTGMSCVLRSLGFAPGDIIICFSTTYGAVKKLLRQVCIDSGAQIKEIKITLPVTSALEIMEVVREVVCEKGVKMIVVDHVPSNVPIIFPLQQIVALSHQFISLEETSRVDGWLATCSSGVQVLVDGAHALGMLPLSMKTIDADYYVSNTHKWLSNPKGAAFLYVRRQLQPSVRSLVVSHGYGSGFNSEFMWTGLKDYSAFLALHTTLDFWEEVGVETFEAYAVALARRSGSMLATRWGTRLAAPEAMFGDDMRILEHSFIVSSDDIPDGSMVLVELPRALYLHGNEVTYGDAEGLQNRLYHEFNIEVPVKTVDGKLYVRLSCHLHTSAEDVEVLARAVLTMAQT